MANDFIPNSFQHPNIYVDKYMSFLTNNELRVLLYMMRRIFGFQKRQDTISLSQMTDGIVTNEGERLDYGAGLSRPACIKAVKGLKEFGLVQEVAENDPETNNGKCYALQLDPAQVNFSGLVSRKEEARKVETNRTTKARNQKAVNGIDSPLASKPHLPPLVNDTYPPRLVPFTHNNQLETQEKPSNGKETTPRANGSAAVPAQPTTTTAACTGKSEAASQDQPIPIQETLFPSPGSAVPANLQPPKPAAKKRGATDAHPNTQPILDAYLALLGYPPSNRGREAKAAKALALAGYTPEQVSAAYKLMKQETFWQGKHLFLDKVHDNIGAMLPAISAIVATGPVAGYRTTERGTFLHV